MYKIRSEGEEWIEVPSVTKVLDCLNKEALPWWGMVTGIEAVRQLVELELLAFGHDGNQYGLYIPGSGGHLLDTSELTEYVSANKLTVNHVKGKAADRGTGVHAALEAWAAVGQLPDPASFPWEEQGYVTGLRAFLDAATEAGLTAERFEVTVASKVYGYAGRFDVLSNLERDLRVVTKVFPKNQPKYTIVPGGTRGLIDLKTSKGIYESHFLQLEGYEQGLVECGYGPTDWRAVLHVMADGRYEFRRARATIEQYAAVVAVSNAMRDVKASMKL